MGSLTGMEARNHIFFLNDGVERINEMAQPYDNDKEDDMQYFMEAR